MTDLEVENLQRDAVFVFIMFLFVVSAAEQNVVSVPKANYEPMKFVLSQTEMPIYQLVTPEVNETYVQSLVSSLFGLHDLVAQEAEGIYFVNWSNSYLEVDSSDGSIWYADYDRLWNISSGDNLPDATESEALVDAWVAETGLVPANALFAGLGTTNATIYNINTHAMYSKIIHYHFNYAFDLGEIPISEQSAAISVIVGETGNIPGSAENIVGLEMNWRDINPTPYTYALLIEFDSILTTYGISADDVVTYSLVYETGEEDSNNDLL